MDKGFIDSIKKIPLRNVAAVIGMRPARMSSLTPCPHCNATVRGSKDKRGPVGLTPNGQGFMCHRCKASGDTVDLVSYHLSNKRLRDMSTSEMKNLVDFARDQGWVSDGHTRAKSISDIVGIIPCTIIGVICYEFSLVFSRRSVSNSMYCLLN